DIPADRLRSSADAPLQHGSRSHSLLPPVAFEGKADFQPALRQAAASNAMAGRPEQAHKAVARLRQLNPALRVSNLKRSDGPFAGRRPLAIRRRIAASRAARMTVAATLDRLQARLPLLARLRHAE